MFCSTIIPTIGRSSLNRAVESVLDQSFPGDSFEIIVVNDSARPLPEAAWHDSGRVTILQTQRRERSFARNAGAAVAKGRYLHFLDDDDWLVPGAYEHLWELSEKVQVGWMYGESELVSGSGERLLRLQHRMNGNCFVQAMAGEWIPLQSSMIDSSVFFSVGGFNTMITGPEDIDLLRRVMLVAELAETQNHVATIVRDDVGTSTDYDRHPEQSRWAREKILNAHGVLKRMHESADRPFWYGRILRAYLTSLIWNLQHRRLMTAFSRSYHCGLSMLVSGTRVFNADYFRAVVRPYQSFTFQRLPSR